MIDISAAVSILIDRLEKLPTGQCLEIRTYKRNRRVLFRKDAKDAWSALQDGFARDVYEGIPRDKLRKLVQSLLRKEFPRSTKIRVYTLGPCRLDKEPRPPRKIL